MEEKQLLIYALDDEALSLQMLCRVISQAEPAAEVRPFSVARKALESLENGEHPDVIFSDIEMPGLSGLELANKIRQTDQDVKLIFVTAYSEYALDAYRAHVNGYVLKPVTVEQIREELDSLNLVIKAPAEKPLLKVRCFDDFEVFYQGEPLIFERKRTKEMFAFLVDREGAACTSEEIITALWEGSGNLKNRKSYLRTLAVDLRNTLESIGMGDVLIHEHRQWAVRTNLLDCDYYRLRDGDEEALEMFRGEYMMQYSWAEPTATKLQFKYL